MQADSAPTRSPCPALTAHSSWCRAKSTPRSCQAAGRAAHAKGPGTGGEKPSLLPRGTSSPGGRRPLPHAGLGRARSYLLLLQHVVQSVLSCYFLYKILGEPPQGEEGSPQGLLGNLAEKEGLVFKAVSCLQKLYRCQEEEKRRAAVNIAALSAALFLRHGAPPGRAGSHPPPPRSPP